ncbi:nudC domain-containing protein 3 [Lates japonicus]|uniref:NudC domain-containing protein 3 n=1 Tax=Lates japonicus TaxID=270547 RepID=A0AAD3R404_LATJO|nr:nudC domain-containing protein 3 [Lates japonicus]
MLKKGWDAEGSPFKGQQFDPSMFDIPPSALNHSAVRRSEVGGDSSPRSSSPQRRTVHFGLGTRTPSEEEAASWQRLLPPDPPSCERAELEGWRSAVMDAAPSIPSKQNARCSGAPLLLQTASKIMFYPSVHGS